MTTCAKITWSMSNHHATGASMTENTTSMIQEYEVLEDLHLLAPSRYSSAAPELSISDSHNMWVDVENLVASFLASGGSLRSAHLKFKSGNKSVTKKPWEGNSIRKRFSVLSSFCWRIAAADCKLIWSSFGDLGRKVEICSLLFKIATHFIQHSCNAFIYEIKNEYNISCKLNLT